MNTIKNSIQKALVGGMAALALTVVSSWTFVQSTSVAPGVTFSAVQMAQVKLQQRHVWFGQSQPAVLVD